MTKNTFKYYKDENGAFKIEMTPNAARDVANYLKGFETAMQISTYDNAVRTTYAAENVANQFLENKKTFEALKEAEFLGEAGIVSGYVLFLDEVKAKIGELLG